mgnify:CR=1 FL=1
MKEKILSTNAEQSLVIRWDGVRFALVEIRKKLLPPKKTIIVSLDEMLELVNFAGCLGKE